MNPSTQSRRRRLADAIVHHPRPIARARLVLFGLTLLALGVIGTLTAMALAPAVEDGIKRCTYNAVEVDPPPDAERVEISQTFSIRWKIANTGSCTVWPGARLVRRSDEIQSAVASYPVGSPAADETVSPNQPARDVVIVTTVLTAPAQAGAYQTEWQLQIGDDKFFGAPLIRRVQVYRPESPPLRAIANQPQLTLGGALRLGLSFVYYLLPALLAVAFVLWRATDFMNKLFGFKPPTSSFKHLTAMMFGLGSSGVFVKQGKIEHDPANTAAEEIGGPAWLTVSDYSAVVLERGAGFSRVVGPGITFLLPHECVRGAVDLQTQHRTVTEKTLSKDGLPIQVDVEMTFRITPKDQQSDVPPETPRLGLFNRLKHRLGLRVPPALLEASRPHRFSREAVRRAIYETPVLPLSLNIPPDWSNSFANVRAGDISDQLAELRFDEVNAPDDPDRHPRRDIIAKGLADAREIAAKQGTGIEMIDMTMGVVELQKEYRETIGEQKKEYRDPLIEQMITSWRAEWNRRATVLDAQGEARRTQLLEEARAEAQANMIQALTEGFRIATGDSDNKFISSEVIVLRFIDTLEALVKTSVVKDKPPDLGFAHIA
jgi:regulator of protease activity HflC (stomatin/prohibitin superfamily)